MRGAVCYDVRFNFPRRPCTHAVAVGGGKVTVRLDRETAPRVGSDSHDLVSVFIFALLVVCCFHIFSVEI